MAKATKTVTDKKLGKIQADYEAGIEKKSNIATKYRINRLTLLRYAKKYKWEYGKSNKDVTRYISKKATAQIVENESRKLIDYTTKHLAELETIRGISRSNAKALSEEIKNTKNNVSRDEAERMFAVQKVCKITTETLTMIYKDERLAMGLDKENDSGNAAIEDRIKSHMEKYK